MSTKQKKIDLSELSAFLATCSPETKVYLGCDSERFKLNGVWYADYILAVVVHINGRHGCRLFGEVQREKDVDAVKSRPFNRMMTEAAKVAELYERLREVLYDFEVEVHLDISGKVECGSNVAAQAAIGFIKGTLNVVPMIKPNGWAASYAADRMKDITGISA